MKKIFFLLAFCLSFMISKATIYVVVVAQNSPDLTSVCPGDTLRFSGDSLNQTVYGSIIVTVRNVDSTLYHTCAVASYYNVATYCDHIFTQGDFYWEWTPQVLGNGIISFNCLSGINSNEEKEKISRIYPNPTSDHIDISSSLLIDNVSLYNLLGIKMLDLNLNSKSQRIDISEYPQGVYNVLIKTGFHTESKRLLKF